MVSMTMTVGEVLADMADEDEGFWTNKIISLPKYIVC